MARGRKPIPAHLRIVGGNPGKRPLPKKKRHVPTGLRAPSDLTDTQKKLWKKINRDAPYQLLKAIDVFALKRYVVALSIYDKAKHAIENSTLVIAYPSGYPGVNPWLGILNKQSDILLRLESEFGFTPSSRTKVGVLDDPYDDEDDFD